MDVGRLVRDEVNQRTVSRVTLEYVCTEASSTKLETQNIPLGHFNKFIF